MPPAAKKMEDGAVARGAGRAKSTRAMAKPTEVNRSITMAEVGRHDKEGDAWVTVNDKVYDISQWVANHPGGSIPLLQYAGRDITDAFRAYHGPAGKAAKTLRSYYVGDLEPAEDGNASDGSSSSSPEQVPEHLTAFRKMVNGLEGEFHTEYAHYAKLGTSLVALISAAVYLIAAPGHGVWAHMLGAVLLGFFWQQTMFIGHDAGHGRA